MSADNTVSAGVEIMKMRLLAVWLILCASAGLADTPVGPMNYQGRLLNNGIPVGYPSPTTANFVVKVYDAASGGILKYQETHSNVTVDDGVYNFLVGTKPKDAGDSTWSVELWNCCINGLYMEITANGQILLPRSRLAAAPYAFQANLALTTNNALALGGKSATDYDNVLAAICVSGRGKWLDKLGKCLGRGAVIQNQTLSTMLNNPLDTNFRNLDLTGADLTGTNFTGVDFSSSTFNGTTYSPQHFGATNLNNTVWTNAIKVGALDSLPASAADAHFTGTDISGFRFSQFTNSTQYKNIVIAYMNACPAAVSRPPSWGCYDHISNASKKLLAGPHGDYSANSPLAVEDYMGRNKLDVAWYIYLTDYSYSKFDGAYITSWNAPEDGTFTGSSFKDTYFYGNSIYFSYMTFNNSDFSNAVFDRLGGSSYMNVTGANLSNTRFSGFSTILSFSGTVNMAYTTLEEMDISTNVAGSCLNLNNATIRNTTLNATANILSGSSRIENLYISGPVGNCTGFTAFSYARFYGDLRLSQTISEPMTINGSQFNSVNMKGTYAGVTFTNNTFDSVDFSKANFLNATFGAGNTFTNVYWNGAVCPNGIVFPNVGENCP